MSRIVRTQNGPQIDVVLDPGMDPPKARIFAKTLCFRRVLVHLGARSAPGKSEFRHSGARSAPGKIQISAFGHAKRAQGFWDKSSW